MVKPWEMTSEEIQEWASRLKASGDLPKLVRRLLFATNPLDGIEMRGDAGTRYEGWDGVVRSRVATAFCPAGLSVWELSVETKVGSKLDKDYEKRSRKPPEGVQPKLATYVAVTARQFPKKAGWAAAKRAEGVWADVRAYDADDLGTWIEQAPAVGRWFANLQGRPAYEGKDVEAFLEEWRKRTSPPLPVELVLVGEERQGQSDQLLGWLGVPSDRPLLIRGRTREEALLFAAASLAREPGADARLSRALVVETEEAWRWALRVQAGEGMILLPAYDKPDVGQAVAAKVRVILPGDRSAPVQIGSTLTLDEQPYKQLAKVLEEGGWSAGDAERLVRAAGGDLEALQRRCGYIHLDLPSWAKDSPRAELIALLLAGAWMPTIAGDREALRRLGGDPAVSEQVCADLIERGKMKRVPEHFRRDVLAWNSLEDGWGLLVRGLTDSHLDNFSNVVMDVLGEMDPAYDLPKEERFMAALKGKTLAHSEALRNGLAESLVLLPLHDAVFMETRASRKGSQLAEGLVKWLLHADRGWKAWASLSRQLPLLAEAAPEGFLDRIEASLARGEEGVARLLHEEPPSTLGSAPHIGLLWALEMLGWHPDSNVRRGVIHALTRLAAQDPGKAPGGFDHRPLHSLDALLRYAFPASSTTAEERIVLSREVLRTSLETGRKLSLDMLRQLHGMVLLHPGYKPRFHEKEWCRDEATDVADVRVQVSAALDDLIHEAGTVAERWAKLVEAVRHSEVEEHVLDALAKQQEHIQDADGRLWATLREEQIWDNDEESRSQRAEKYRSLYATFTPRDFVRRNAWLFAPYSRIPGTLDGEDERRTKWMADAIRELWRREDRWDTLAALVREVGKFEFGNWRLGHMLGASSFADEMEPRILSDKDEEAFAPLVVGFTAERVQDQRHGLPWLEKVLRRFVEHGRLAEAVQIATGRGAEKPLWEVVNRIGQPFIAEYWKATPRIVGEPSLEDLQYAVDQLLAVGREHAAINTVAAHRRTATGGLALQVLKRYAERLNAASLGERQGLTDQMTSRYVEWLLEIIDRDPPSGRDPIEEIAPLELYFLPLLSSPLSKPSRPTRYVSAAFTKHPEFFVDLIAKLYRREGEERPAQQDEERARVAKNAFSILKAWKGYPGEGVSEAERETLLEPWAAEVLSKTREAGRGRAGSLHVAEVLARVPDGSDGFWPCVTARRLLETGLYPDLSDHLALAKRNLRGMTGRALDEGGVQEREIADKYREAARQLEATYPRTAAMLDGLARGYDAEAKRHDVEARRFRIEHGEQPSEPEEPPSTPRDASTPARTEFISRIATTAVGPEDKFDIPLRPRLNLLIGDNSLGKTFVLEVLWWALTGAWSNPKLPVKPEAPRRNGHSLPPASIRAEAGGRSLVGEYDHAKEAWKKKGRALAPGLTLYARADGGFSIWDPIRNGKPTEKTSLDLSKGYRFTPDDIWYGLSTRDRTTVLCRGLLEDAVLWRSERRKAFSALEHVLEKLSPPGQPIKFTRPKRFKINEARDYPRLDLGYREPLFAVHASAAVKRILGLAYALVWAVTEIQEAAPMAGHAPLRRVTMLIDEIEAHLHPRWQRAILPALLTVMEDLAPQADVQLIVTTHAPLVLASMEMSFDPAQDAFLEFEEDVTNKGKRVRVVPEPFEMLGDVNTWLMQHFGLKQPRGNKEAEDAIEAAAAAMKNPKLSKKEGKALHEKLGKVLGQLDPFWVRWRYIAEKRGWIS